MYLLVIDGLTSTVRNFSRSCVSCPASFPDARRVVDPLAENPHGEGSMVARDCKERLFCIRAGASNKLQLIINGTDSVHRWWILRAVNLNYRAFAPTLTWKK